MTFRNYLAGTIFVVLLIWGPIDHSWTAFFAIRIAYLIFVPLAVWLLLGWIWNNWQPNDKKENSLKRILSAMICIGLVAFAIQEATLKIHVGNTKGIQTRDGMEAVGDDIILHGPDWGNVFVILLIAGLVLWLGIIKKEAKSTNNNSLN